MANQIDPDLARILPLLPLRDAANLTPSRARLDLVTLADSRKDVPLPQPAAVADLEIATAAGAIPDRIYRPARTPTARPDARDRIGGGCSQCRLSTPTRGAFSWHIRRLLCGDTIGRRQPRQARR